MKKWKYNTLWFESFKVGMKGDFTPLFKSTMIMNEIQRITKSMNALYFTLFPIPRLESVKIRGFGVLLHHLWYASWTPVLGACVGRCGRFTLGGIEWFEFSSLTTPLHYLKDSNNRLRYFYLFTLLLTTPFYQSKIRMDGVVCNCPLSHWKR